MQVRTLKVSNIVPCSTREHGPRVVFSSCLLHPVCLSRDRSIIQNTSSFLCSFSMKLSALRQSESAPSRARVIGKKTWNLVSHQWMHVPAAERGVLPVLSRRCSSVIKGCCVRLHFLFQCEYSVWIIRWQHITQQHNTVFDLGVLPWRKLIAERSTSTRCSCLPQSARLDLTSYETRCAASVAAKPLHKPTNGNAGDIHIHHEGLGRCGSSVRIFSF